MSKYNTGDYIQIKIIDELLKTYQGMESECEAIRKQTSFRSRSGLLFIESMFSLCGKVYKCIDNDYFNGDTRICVGDKRKFHYYRISPEWIKQAKEMDFNIDKEKILSII